MEKQKIAKEVQILQQNRSNRDKTFTSEYMLMSVTVSIMSQSPLCSGFGPAVADLSEINQI